MIGFKHLRLNSIKLINLISTSGYNIPFPVFNVFLFNILLGKLRKDDSFFIQSWIVVGGIPNLIEAYFCECSFAHWIIFNLDLIVYNISPFYD